LHIENKNGKGHLLKTYLPHLGELKDLRKVIEQHEVEEVLIAIESWEHEYLRKIIEELETTQVMVKIIPDVYDILSGSVKMTSIFGEPLIEISNHYLLPWQKVLKRVMDIFASVLSLVILSPIYMIVAFIVKATSHGPVFYSHERIGLNGQPFTMYKFRSMYVDAERNGPSLSSKDDPRITPFGKFMRKVRLDELPQFYNVLIGEMSLVGPRPERRHFIDLIVKEAPHYRLLHKIKPGITSWGQVKFGYAENVEEMIQRMKYDLLYLENMSILVDLKILIYTVLIVVQGRGK
jgi:exopolysaccharide biosynthesis polyprenyl glycosylphosphotransferase